MDKFVYVYVDYEKYEGCSPYVGVIVFKTFDEAMKSLEDFLEERLENIGKTKQQAILDGNLGIDNSTDEYTLYDMTDENDVGWYGKVLKQKVKGE